MAAAGGLSAASAGGDFVSGNSGIGVETIAAAGEAGGTATSIAGPSGGSETGGGLSAGGGS